MNKRDRKGIAAAFRAAKPLLMKDEFDFTGKYEFVCHALENSGHKYAFHAIDVIQDRIHPNISVSGWLERHGFSTGENRVSDDLQAYRHRWLDALIAEFEDDSHADR